MINFSTFVSAEIRMEMSSPGVTLQTLKMASTGDTVTSLPVRVRTHCHYFTFNTSEYLSLSFVCLCHHARIIGKHTNYVYF